MPQVPEASQILPARCDWIARLLTLVLLGWSLSLNQAHAEQWQLQPTVQLNTGFDDNVRLSAVEPEEAFYARLSGALRAIRSTEISSAALSLGLVASRYPGIRDLDNTSGYVGVDLDERFERNRLRMRLRLDSQSTLYSEQSTTGLVQVNRQQNSLLVSPSWSHNLSERAVVDLSATYQEVSYDQSGALPLFDYRVGSLDLGASYGLSERLDLSARASFGRYETQGITNDYDNISVQAGVVYALSETQSLSALAGFRQTEQTVETPDGDTLTETSSGPSYSVMYRRTFEGGSSLQISAQRDLTPSGSAEVLDTTRLSAQLLYVLQPRWRLTVQATAYRNRDPAGDSGRGDRTFASFEPRLSYDLDESWTLSAGYRYRWQTQDRDLGSSNADSNSLYLILRWVNPWIF